MESIIHSSRQYYHLLLCCLLIGCGSRNNKSDNKIFHDKSLYSFLGLDKSNHLTIDSNEIVELIKNDTLVTTTVIDTNHSPDISRYNLRSLVSGSVGMRSIPFRGDRSQKLINFSDLYGGYVYWVSHIPPSTVFCINILSGETQPTLIGYQGCATKLMVDDKRIYLTSDGGISIYSKKDLGKIVEFKNFPVINFPVDFIVRDSIIYISGISDTILNYTHVIAYDLNKNIVLWKTEISDQNENEILLDKDNIFIQSRSTSGPSQNVGTLFCIDKRTGIKKWEDNKVNTITTPVIYNDDVFCEDINQDKLKCINMNNDEVKWVKEYRFSNPLYSPFVFHDNLYLPEEGWIYHINIANGNVIDSIETDTRDIQCLHDNKMHPYFLVGREIFW